MKAILELIGFDCLSVQKITDALDRQLTGSVLYWRIALQSHHMRRNIDLSLVKSGGLEMREVVEAVNKTRGKLVALVGDDAPRIGLPVLPGNFMLSDVTQVYLEEFKFLVHSSSRLSPHLPSRSRKSDEARRKKVIHVLAINFSEAHLADIKYEIHGSIDSDVVKMVKLSQFDQASFHLNTQLYDVLLLSLASEHEAFQSKDLIEEMADLVNHTSSSSFQMHAMVFCDAATASLVRAWTRHSSIKIISTPQERTESLDAPHNVSRSFYAANETDFSHTIHEPLPFLPSA